MRPGLRGRSVPGTARQVCGFGRARGPGRYLCAGVQGPDEVLAHAVMESVRVRELSVCQGACGRTRVRGEGRPGAAGCRDLPPKEAPRVRTEAPAGACVHARVHAQALRRACCCLRSGFGLCPAPWEACVWLRRHLRAALACLPACRRRQPSARPPGAWDRGPCAGPRPAAGMDGGGPGRPDPGHGLGSSCHGCGTARPQLRLPWAGARESPGWGP